MAHDLQLRIDLADPEDIKAKLPHARAMLGAKRRAVKDAEREHDNWELLVQRLEILAGVDGAEKAKTGAASRQPAPAQDAVVRIVEREGRPMRPPEVAGMLRSEGFPVASTNAINAALYAAAQSGRLVRPKKGWYAPRGYDEDRSAVVEDAQELLASASEAQS